MSGFHLDTMQLISVGHLHPSACWGMAAHAHTEWEFIYFLRGCGRVELPQGSFRPRQYHLMVYPPGLPHAEMADPLDPEETIFFAVDVTGDVPWGASLLLSDPDGELRWLCEHLLQEFAAHGISPLATAYLHAFLLLIERAWQRSPEGQPDPVEVAAQFMLANFPRSMTLRELASIVRVSETHLAHRFSARMGISPMRFLRNIRIDAAKRLLTTTPLQVQEIAMRVGYADQLYFSRVFKRTTGYPPQTFRRRDNCTISSIPETRESIVRD